MRRCPATRGFLRAHLETRAGMASLDPGARTGRQERQGTGGHVMSYLLLALGLAGLFLGGEFLVRGAVAIARGLGLSPLVIGLTVVGFGTSAPELLVSVDAARQGAPGIAIGNVVGSNIANILLIVGVSVSLAPLIIGFVTVRRDLLVMLAATLALWLMILDGNLSRIEGLALLAGLAGFLTLALASLRGGPDMPDDDGGTRPMPAWKAGPIAIAGLGLLVVSADLVVENATLIARGFGVSEAVIGLTVVAIGTSLPELATAIVSALRGQSDIAVGNIVGSNIFNILCILGLTALIAPVPVEPRFVRFDMAVAFAAAAGFTVLLIPRRLPRMVGPVLLAGYAAYMGAVGLA